MTTYVIMNVATEMQFRKPGQYGPTTYQTERGAKIACTRINKKFGEHIVMTSDEFENAHNPLVAVYNSITGDGVTPVYIRKSEVGGCCDPSTERYHSM